MKTEVRIIEHTHPLYMAMFSDEGNIAVSNAVNNIILAACEGRFVRRELRKVINTTFDHIEKTHPEVYDTEVRMKIARRINTELCVPAGWQQIDYFFDDEGN